MSRILALALSLFALLVLVIPSTMAEETIPLHPLDHPSDNSANPASPGFDSGIRVTFSTDMPNNLFLYGKPVEVTAHISNSGDEQNARITFTLQTGLGCIVFRNEAKDTVPARGTLDRSYTIGDQANLPRGPYIAQVIVKGETNWAFQETHLGIWDGPLEKQNDGFGISYLGPLNTARMLADLDLFKQAGVGWLRFQLHGWLPQGVAVPPEAEFYNSFIQKASDRGFKLLAAFTPQITVDSSVNAAQAAKDFHESLLAAAARYNFTVKSWELLKVPPPSYPKGLHGIDFGEIKEAGGALQRFDKTLQVIFPVDGSALLDNANTWNLNGQPTGINALGIHYNLSELPENQQTNGPDYVKQPAFESSRLSEIAKHTKQAKITSSCWVTEYGFDGKSEFEKKLKQVDVYHAAILSRMLIMNRLSRYPHVFWRHNPDNPTDIPFTAADNSAQPTLLALRTTLDQLTGLSGITAIFSSLAGQEKGVNLYVLRYGGEGKKHKHAHYKLVAWSDRVSTRSGMAILTSAAHLKVTDIWGNSVDLLPTGNVAIFQMDEFPHFIDLGTDSQIKIMNAIGTANFATPYKLVAPHADNNIAFRLQNNQKIFNKHIAGKLTFNVWPEAYQDIITQTEPFGYDLAPFNRCELPCAKFPDNLIPEDAQTMHELCEIGVDIMMGDRRMGYLTQPVFFSPLLRPIEK